MYTILVNETNELITSVRERIMQRSKLVDSLHFLVDPIYKGIDMSDFVATLEYVLPVSREYKTETLVKSGELYKEKLEYKLPLDTSLTAQAGDIEIQLTFTKVVLNPDGSNTQQVRKTSSTTITILPITAWSSIIPDSALSALDQRIIMTQAMLEATNEMTNYLDMNKADDIVFDKTSSTIYLTANGKQIGSKISLNGAIDSIVGIRIDGDNNIIVTYSDSREEIVGKMESGCEGVYIPDFKDNGGILTFTLKDKAEDERYEFDIRDSDNWHEISSVEAASTYVWQEI